MRAQLVSAIAMAFAFALAGCDSAKYVKDELHGTAKPEGGIQEAVPTSKTYTASSQEVRRATLKVLDAQGYIYEENPSTGTIKTEPKPLTDNSQVKLLGAAYSARVFIKLDGPTVSYRATFDKKSNVTMGDQNIEFPEKEAELRKQFFAMLDGNLPKLTNIQAPASKEATISPIATPAKSVGASQQNMTVQQIQKRLADLGYQPGPADGKMGKGTIDALKRFQRDNKLTPTGQADNETVAKLRQ